MRGLLRRTIVFIITMVTLFASFMVTAEGKEPAPSTYEVQCLAAVID